MPALFSKDAAYSLLLEAADDPVLVLSMEDDDHAAILDANEAARYVLGVAAEALADHTLYDFLAPGAEADLAAAMARLKRTAASRFVINLQSLGGQVFSAAVNVRALPRKARRRRARVSPKPASTPRALAVAVFRDLSKPFREAPPEDALFPPPPSDAAPKRPFFRLAWPAMTLEDFTPDLCELLETTEEELRANPELLNALPPASLLETFKRKLDEGAAGAVESVEQIAYTRANGDIRWLNMRVMLVTRPASGSETLQSFLQCELTDVTSSHEPVRDLENSRQALRALVNAAPSPVFLLREDGVMMECNRAMAHSLGLSSKEARSANLRDFVPPHLWETRLPIFMEALRSGQPQVLHEVLGGRFLHVVVAPLQQLDGGGRGAAVFSHDVTDLVMAQKDLIAKERFLNGVFHAIQDGVDVVGVDQTILRDNKALSRWFPHMAPLAGRKRSAVFYGTDTPPPQDPVAAVLHTGLPHAAVVRTSAEEPTILEEPRWLEVFSHPLFNSEGRLWGAVQYTRDITGRIRLETLLEHERARLRSLLEANVVGVAFLSPELRWLDVNQHFLTLVGHQEAVSDVFDYEEKLVPEDLRAFTNRLGTLVSGERDGFSMDACFINESGVETFVALSIVAVRNAPRTKRVHSGVGDSVSYYIAVAQDISGRKVMERQLVKTHSDLEKRVRLRTRQLLESEANLRALLNAPVVSSLLLDEENRVLAVNDVGAQRLGVRVEELLGSNILEQFTEEIAERRRAKMDEARITGEPVTFQDSRDGMHFSITIYPVPAVLKSPSWHHRLAVFAEDITRTRELERQLRQAQKMEALGALAGGVAHDFNNMLGVILANVEMLLARELRDTRTTQSLQRVFESAMKARDMIKQILTFSRTSTVEKRVFDLTEAVRHDARLIRSSLPATASLQLQIASETMRVRADQTQFSQVLMNLCVNAEQALGEGGGTIQVSLERVTLDDTAIQQDFPELAPGNYARLVVHDSGAGIPADHLERIFEPFFTTKNKEEGTGLGLSAAHSIVTRHNGAIRASSILGDGSRFTVLLPLTDEQEESTTPPREDEQPDNTRAVLLVDDDYAYRQSIAQALETMGYAVTQAASGDEALERYRAEPDVYDLVISDQTMPGMSGKQLAAALRQHGLATPFLLCTGYSQFITEETLRKHEIKLMMKPFTLNELQLVMRQLLQPGEPPRSSMQGPAS